MNREMPSFLFFSVLANQLQLQKSGESSKAAVQTSLVGTTVVSRLSSKGVYVAVSVYLPELENTRVPGIHPSPFWVLHAPRRS